MNNILMATLFLVLSIGVGYMFIETTSIGLFFAQIVLFVISILYIQKALDRLL